MTPEYRLTLITETIRVIKIGTPVSRRTRDASAGTMA